MILHRLLPDGAQLSPEALLAEVRPAERAPTGRPFVYLNMVSSLDGRAAVAGSTRKLGGAADLALLLELRTIADAVLIGTGTLRAEGYDRLIGAPDRRSRRRSAGLAEDPPAVLISRGLDLDWEAGLFQAPEQPVLIYTGADAAAPAVAAPVEVVRLADPTPAEVMADLRRRGVRALLCESGPVLNGALLAAGLVDELFLTLSPLVTGEPGAPRIVEGGALPAPASLALRWVCHHEGELYLRYAL